MVGVNVVCQIKILLLKSYSYSNKAAKKCQKKKMCDILKRFDIQATNPLKRAKEMRKVGDRRLDC